MIAYKLGKKQASQSFINYVGEERYKKLINFILHYIADLDIPVKRSAVHLVYALFTHAIYRGTFIEFRNGMVNVSPIGRNATWVSSFSPVIVLNRVG